MQAMTTLNNEATGYLEVASYIAALLASDAMAKAACVTLEAVHKPTGGLVCIYVHGSLADCQAAIAAGTAVAQSQGTLEGSIVIGRPAEDTADIWSRHIPEMQRRKAAIKYKSVPVVASGTEKTTVSGKSGPRSRNKQKSGKKGENI